MTRPVALTRCSALFLAFLLLLTSLAGCSSRTAQANHPPAPGATPPMSMTPPPSPTGTPTSLPASPTVPPKPSASPTPKPPLPTPTPLPPTPSPTPPPLASVIIQNMDVQFQGGSCYAVADVMNSSNNVAYNVTGQALLVASGYNVVPQATFDLTGQNDLFPGQTERYQGYVSIVNLTNVPVSITVTMFQHGQQIGKASTLNPATCH